jgi:hypothetical protein
MKGTYTFVRHIYEGPLPGRMCCHVLFPNCQANASIVASNRSCMSLSKFLNGHLPVSFNSITFAAETTL